MPDKRRYPSQEHNLKTNRLTYRLVRLIAAHTGEKQYAVLERLLTAEWRRLQDQGDPLDPLIQKGP